MSKSEQLQRELNLIHDDTLRTIVTDFLNIRVPDYFYVVPASSIGKYHPQISQGQGGLVRHTKMAVEIANSLFELTMWGAIFDSKDLIISALIIHDTFKLGEPQQKYMIHDHPIVASEAFKKFAKTYTYPQEKIEVICKIVSSHMGQWARSKYCDVVLPTPQTPVEKFAHLCDFISSQKFIGNLDYIE